MPIIKTGPGGLIKKVWALGADGRTTHQQEVFKVVNVSGFRIALVWEDGLYNRRLMATCVVTGVSWRRSFVGPYGGELRYNFVVENRQLSTDLAREQLQALIDKVGVEAVRLKIAGLKVIKDDGTFEG